MSTTHSLVVKAYRPWRYRITILILLALAIAAVTYAYHRGLADGGYFRGEARVERERMESDLAEAARTEQRLREQVAVLERAQEVSQAARENLRRDVVGLQDDIQQLREELAFYRGIVSPEDGQRGLQVQEFSITPTGDPGHYQYSLMLIQALTHDRRVDGQARITVQGRLDGEPHSLDLATLSGRDALHFSFRYFQGFDGEIQLPEGFEPQEVELSVQPSGRNRSAIEERREWPNGQ